MSRRDQSALAEFYNRTSPMVHGLVRRIVNNRAIAEEVTLDIYLRVWRQAGEYSAVRETPMTWLILLVRSQAIAALGYAGQETLERSLGPNSPALDLGETGQEIEATHGRQAVVRSALNSFTPADRGAVEMAFFRGLSHSAIAEKLGLPLGKVKAGIRMGMLQIREHLRQSDEASLPSTPDDFSVRGAISQIRGGVSQWTGNWRSQGKEEQP